MAPIHPFRRALIGVLGTALIALPLVALGSTPAQAETPGVVATCAGLTVKPNGYAAKGELRIVVDGEAQTDGDESGWTTFKGSYPGVYAFEPDAVHRYTVEINSFADDAAGRAFEPGTGGDVRITGTTTACAPVVVTGAGSNCTSDRSAGAQSVSLEFSGLRRSVTYLSEILDGNGEVLKHFEFRTAPVVEHRFTGLTAGTTYLARVTDESNPVLSGAAVVRVGDCATTPTVSLRFSQCTTADPRTATLSADLSDLVEGRDYRVTVAAGSVRSRTVHASDSVATASFGGLERGDGMVVTVADEDAPRTVTVPAVVPVCDGRGGQPGTPSTGSSGTSNPGSGSSQPGGGPTNPGSGSSQPGGGTPSSPTGHAPSGGTTHQPGPGSSRPSGSSSGAPASGSVPGTAAPAASPTAVAAAADAGPGDSGTGLAAGGSAAGGNGLVAATEQRGYQVPTAAIPLGLSALAALGLAVGALVRRRRAG